MKKLKILVVDDLVANRFLLTEILKTVGHESIQAKNGKEAIEKIEQNKNIDIVLMDIEMPVMNGIETVLHIRNKMFIAKDQLPVVALTAHNPEIFFQDYRDVEFDEILTKPYSIDRVLLMITKFFPDTNLVPAK